MSQRTSQRVVIAGASGFVGARLAARLRAAGHEVRRLVRDPRQADEADAVPWDPPRERLEAAVPEWADAVINLCGRNIGAGRWTAAVKRELVDSRLIPTSLLAATIAAARRPPRVLINASASGYYGHRGEDEVDESSPAGSGFLADLCRRWEKAAASAGSASTRVVRLRLGMILGPGGALERMTPIFRLGLGGPLGSGRQWWPWVSIDDVEAVIERALDDDALHGPVNVVSPTPSRCHELCRALGRALHRPAILPTPAPALRLALGEMADEVLLASTRVRPTTLLDLDHAYRHPDLDDAIASALSD